MNTEEENEALRVEDERLNKEFKELSDLAAAQEASDRAAFDSGEEKYKLIAACEYGEHCLEIVPPPRTARLVYLTEEESDAAIKSGKISAFTTDDGKHIDATVDVGMDDKLRNAQPNLSMLHRLHCDGILGPDCCGE